MDIVCWKTIKSIFSVLSIFFCCFTIDLRFYWYITCFNLILLWFNLSFDDQLQVDFKIYGKIFKNSSCGGKIWKSEHVSQAPNPLYENFASFKFTLRKFHKLVLLCEDLAKNFARVAMISKPNFALRNPLWNLKSFCNLISHTQNALRKPCEIWEGLQTYFATLAHEFTTLWIPTVLVNAKSHLTLYLKASQPCFHFTTPSAPCENPPTTLWTSHDHHLKMQPTPFAPFRPWHAWEEAIPTLQYL